MSAQCSRRSGVAQPSDVEPFAETVESMPVTSPSPESQRLLRVSMLPTVPAPTVAPRNTEGRERRIAGDERPAELSRHVVVERRARSRRAEPEPPSAPGGDRRRQLCPGSERETDRRCRYGLRRPHVGAVGAGSRLSNEHRRGGDLAAGANVVARVSMYIACGPANVYMPRGKCLPSSSARLNVTWPVIPTVDRRG